MFSVHQEPGDNIDQSLNQSSGVPSPQPHLQISVECFNVDHAMTLETALEISELFKETYGQEYPDYMIHTCSVRRFRMGS